MYSHISSINGFYLICKQAALMVIREIFDNSTNFNLYGLRKFKFLRFCSFFFVEKFQFFCKMNLQNQVLGVQRKEKAAHIFFNLRRKFFVTKNVKKVLYIKRICQLFWKLGFSRKPPNLILRVQSGEHIKPVFSAQEFVP